MIIWIHPAPLAQRPHPCSWLIGETLLGSKTIRGDTMTGIKKLSNPNSLVDHLTNNDKTSTPSKPTTDTIVSIIDQDLIVSFNDS